MLLENIVETMINKDVGIGSSYKDDVYYILSSRDEIVNYLNDDHY
jgi:hypothetical protein